VSLGRFFSFGGDWSSSLVPVFMRTSGKLKKYYDENFK